MSSNNPNRVYLDTETTGLHPEEGDEILSLTIVDANGRLLFDERFKPKHKKEWPEAQAVNHISPDDVEHLTTIDAYMEQICRMRPVLPSTKPTARPPKEPLSGYIPTVITVPNGRMKRTSGVSRKCSSRARSRSMPSVSSPARQSLSSTRQRRARPTIRAAPVR